MASPLGDFVRSKRDATAPADLGLVTPPRSRAPGVRRSDLAARAGISVEYLTRIEQGRDRNPSIAVLNAIGDALSLTGVEREHLRYLAKITGGACAGHAAPAPPNIDVRPTVLDTLRLLEPGVAVVTNRLGDLLAYTDAFDTVVRPTGLLDAAAPNLTRFVFTDPRARDAFPDWDHVADERAFELWLGPSVTSSEWFRTGLAPAAGVEFTRRIDQHLPPPARPLRLAHPTAGVLAWDRETLALPDADEQQLVVLLPHDDVTRAAIAGLLSPVADRPLRAV